MLGDQPGVSAATVRALIAGRGDGTRMAVCRYEDGRGHPLAFGRADVRRARRAPWRQGGLEADGPRSATRSSRSGPRADPARRRHPRGLRGRPRRRRAGVVTRAHPGAEPPVSAASRHRHARAAPRRGRLPGRPGPRHGAVPSLRLPQPLLLEGEAGVGKTEAAKALAAALDTELIRLQCYEGIDAAEALYEWNYPRQLLRIRASRGGGDRARARPTCSARSSWSPRPLLRAIEHPGPLPAVLLIDELDRADDDFEAFLFELLAESSVTIPELGTVRASHPPAVVLTSNRTRDLHDALKRRCLYHWIDYPSPEREVEIVPPARARHRAGARRPAPPPRSAACGRATSRSRPGSPRRSTGSPPSSCWASSASTRPPRSARSARCSSTARTRSRSPSRAWTGSSAPIPEAHPARA